MPVEIEHIVAELVPPRPPLGSRRVSDRRIFLELFDAFRQNGTQGAFFGHDHLNNMSLEYKGVRLTYGYSIDFLAYPGINKYGLQRGCSPIVIKPDGTFESTQENYYQSKYVSVKEKAPVDLEKDMSDETGGVENPFAEE